MAVRAAGCKSGGVHLLSRALPGVVHWVHCRAERYAWNLSSISMGALVYYHKMLCV